MIHPVSDVCSSWCIARVRDAVDCTRDVSNDGSRPFHLRQSWVVSGNGLAGVLRQWSPRWLLYPTVLSLLVANTINVGADLGAIAAAINVLVPALPIAPLVVRIAAIILLLQVRAQSWISVASVLT
jgi:hypothetical protein